MPRMRWTKTTEVLILILFVIMLFTLFHTSIRSLAVLRTLNRSPLGSQRPLELQSFVVDNGHTKEKCQRLPNLENIDWPEREYLPYPVGAPDSRALPLAAQFSRGQMSTMWNLFHIFADVMEELGFSDRWMLYGGSLLGSFRHHDFIPWDDDLDVLVDKEVRPALWEKIRALLPNYTILECGRRDKIVGRLIVPKNTLADVEGSRILNTHGSAWPAVDIGYYISNATHIQDTATSYRRTYVYAKYDVFPLLFRPFYKTWAPTPRNAYAFNMQTYSGISKCLSLTYSHAYERSIKSQSMPCTKLARRYAFVERSSLFSPVHADEDIGAEELDWVRERLVRDGEVIHEIDLVAPRGEAFVDPYEIRAKSKR